DDDDLDHAPPPSSPGRTVPLPVAAPGSAKGVVLERSRKALLVGGPLRPGIAVPALTGGRVRRLGSGALSSRVGPASSRSRSRPRASPVSRSTAATAVG